MQDYIQFVVNHWILASLFVLLFIAILAEEARSKGGQKQLSALQATQLINREQAVVIDLRDRTAFQEGHIVGSIQILPSDLEKNPGQLGKYKDRPIILVCTNGQKSGQLLTRLTAEKFEKVYTLAGGITAWKNAQMPLVKK